MNIECRTEEQGTEEGMGKVQGIKEGMYQEQRNMMRIMRPVLEKWQHYKSLEKTVSPSRRASPEEYRMSNRGTRNRRSNGQGMKQRKNEQGIE